jgi:colanic acid biosynthesis glycosyl transferase WcaI
MGVIVSPRKLKILIVSPCYPPDLGPSAPLLGLLAESLVSLGNQVTVLAAVPHYPSGVVLSKYRHWPWAWETCNGVNICRVWIPSGNRANLLHRSLTFLVYQVLATLAGLRLDYEVAFIANPAIETVLPFVVLGLLRRKATVYAVWDVYPEVGIRIGLFRNRAIIQFVKWLEDICLCGAQRIQVLGEGLLADLSSHNIKIEDVAVILPWLDTKFLRPLPYKNDFSIAYELEDKFVVLYAGNFGPAQGLELILEAARLLSNYSEILFLFVGDGVEKDQLVAQASGLRNVRFLPLQPRECLPDVLASSSVSLVTLKSGMSFSSLPSKTFSILASGRPVVACVDTHSDIWNLIESSKAGRCVLPDRPNELANVILTLKNDPLLCEQMGINGRTWAEKYHSLDVVAEKFELLFFNALEDRK